MITTITLSPSIDSHMTIKRLIKDDAIRAVDLWRDPGGKGINVSRAIKELGGDTFAVGFSGGCAGYMLKDLLDHRKIQFDLVDIMGETRINVIITDLSDNTQTRISATGPPVDSKAFSLLVKRIELLSANNISFWVMGGSIPPGLGADVYRELILQLGKGGAKCVLDADGDALRLGIEATPFLVKPNRYEIERLIGQPLNTEEDFIGWQF